MTSANRLRFGRASSPSVPPVNTVAPAITGIQTQGQILTCSTGTWTGTPAPTFSRQWKRNGSSIPGEINATYLLGAADVGQTIICTVTASNAYSATADSNAVVPAAVLALSGTPSPTGTTGQAYSFTPTRTGGHAPYTYALTGALPTGLSFNTSTGAITGTPTVVQTQTGLDITVTDADGLTASLGAFSIAISNSVLSATSFLMGDRAMTGCGVRLSSSTLGLLNTGTPTSWDVTLVSGPTNVLQDRSGAAYLTGVTHTISEGSLATTPEPKSSAAGGANVLSGTWVFSITATGSFGTSNTVNFTINLQANSTSIGDNTSFSSFSAWINAASVASFCGLAGPRYLLLSSGVNRGNSGVEWNALAFTAEVIMADADTARPSNILFFNMQNTGNITFQQIKQVGTTFAPGFSVRARLFVCNDIAFKFCQMGSGPSDLVFSTFGIFSDSAANTRITIEDCKFYGMFAPIAMSGTTWRIRRSVNRWSHRPMVLGGAAGVAIQDVIFEDCAEMSFRYMTGSGFHTENLQRGDNAIASDWIVRRQRWYAADSTWNGPGYFAGQQATNKDTNMQFENIVCGCWPLYAFGQESNAGTSYLKTSTFDKTNSGMKDPTYPDQPSMQPATGPDVYWDASSATWWSGTFTVNHVYAGGKFLNLRSAAANFSSASNLALNSASRPDTTYFQQGDPNVVLSAIPFATWEAMDDATVIATCDAAFLPTALGQLYNRNGDGKYTGAFLPDGSWNPG